MELMKNSQLFKSMFIYISSIKLVLKKCIYISFKKLGFIIITFFNWKNNEVQETYRKIYL